MFSLKFSNQAAKFVKRLEQKDKKRIQKKTEELQKNPFPSDTVRVEKYKDYKVFRVRVGQFRILYSVDFEEKLILIIDVGKRAGVYD